MGNRGLLISMIILLLILIIILFAFLCMNLGRKVLVEELECKEKCTSYLG